MKPSWTERVIGLHPGLVTGVFLLLFFGGSAAINFFPFENPPATAVWAVSMAAMTIPVIIWHYSLRQVADIKSAANKGTRARKPLFFAVLIMVFPLFLITIGSAAMWPTSETLSPLVNVIIPALMMVAVFTYFGAIWTAADALKRYEEGRDSVPFYKTVGTFILEFYLPIGVWFLHPRIRRMLAQEIKNSE